MPMGSHRFEQVAQLTLLRVSARGLPGKGVIVTFSQQMWLVLLQTSSTALFVGVLGTVAGASWSHRREVRKESFETRTKLLNDVAHTGQGMYVFLQHSRRRIIQAKSSHERAKALEVLDERFLAFSIEAAELQTLIGARFGVVRAAPAGDTIHMPPFLRWHQVHDLLALYYYNLKEFFPGIVLVETSVGHDDNYHSGLDMSAYLDRSNLDAEHLRLMRVEIRKAYDEAMIDLARGITSEHIKLTLSCFLGWSETI
jgi:hypothetical protein